MNNVKDFGWFGLGMISVICSFYTFFWYVFKGDQSAWYFIPNLVMIVVWGIASWVTAKDFAG